MFRMECLCEAEKTNRNEEMADEGKWREDAIRSFHRQVKNFNTEILRMRDEITQLERACK